MDVNRRKLISQGLQPMEEYLASQWTWKGQAELVFKPIRYAAKAGCIEGEVMDGLGRFFVHPNIELIFRNVC